MLPPLSTLSKVYSISDVPPYVSPAAIPTPVFDVCTGIATAQEKELN